MVTIPPGDGPIPSSAPAAPARPQQDLTGNERRFRESEPYLRGAVASFGTGADRYDRARPTYPDAMIAAIAAASPGPNVPDGIGTGIAARLFKAHGSTGTEQEAAGEPRLPARRLAGSIGGHAQCRARIALGARPLARLKAALNANPSEKPTLDAIALRVRSVPRSRSSARSILTPTR